MDRLGWFKGRDRQGRQTGVCHFLVRDTASSQPRFACGWKGSHDGQPQQPDRDHKCLSCQRWIRVRSH